jgi:hypothetical protein
MTASKSTPKKVLVIGSTGHAGVKCVDWTSLKDVPNIADFPVVILNTCSLSEWIEALRAARDSAEEKQAHELGKIGSSVSNDLSLLKRKLVQVLRAGGVVYSVLGPYRALVSRQTYYSIVDSHEWMPLPVSVKGEPGEGLTVREERFARYLASVTRWERVFEDRYDPKQLEALTEDELEPKPGVRLASRNLATDWQGNAVGMALLYSLHRPLTGQVGIALSAQRGGQQYEQEPYLSSGPLFLLPPPTEVSDEEAVRILLEDFCGVAARTVAPGWAQGIEMPGDHTRKTALAEATQALEKAERKRDEALQAQAAADEFKRLLYEKGPSLQEIARKTFEAIGISTVDSPVSDEFMLVWDDEKVLVEVTGTGKSIAGRGLSQLIKDQGNYLHDVGQGVKGVLIGNAWVGVPPAERGTADKAIFPDDVQQTAKKHSMALVSTLELFRAYCAFLEDKIAPEQVFRRIADSTGVVTLAG